MSNTFHIGPPKAQSNAQPSGIPRGYFPAIRRVHYGQRADPGNIPVRSVPDTEQGTQ